MGYGSRITGRIEIDPPLKKSEIAKLPDIRDLQIAITEHDTVIDGNEVTVSMGTAITNGDDEEFSRYTLNEDLQSIVDGIPGRVFSGSLIRIGEESGDVERLTVDSNGMIESEMATLRWSDGSVVVW